MITGVAILSFLAGCALIVARNIVGEILSRMIIGTYDGFKSLVKWVFSSEENIDE